MTQTRVQVGRGPVHLLVLLVRQTQAQDGGGQVGDLGVGEHLSIGGWEDGSLGAAAGGQGQGVVAGVEE